MRVVLLVADNTTAHLREFLERRGCQCSAANSLDESIAIFEPRSFDLILNTLTTRDLESLRVLGTSNCDVFSSCPVANSCWWLPIMRGGRDCFGAPALRPNELAGALQETLRVTSVTPN
jgi:hypothetical protein